MTITVKKDDAGAIDEITAENCSLHIERMDESNWYLGIDTSGGTLWQFRFGAGRGLVEVWAVSKST